MSTECHESNCRKHSCHILDEGPFCHEYVCEFKPLRWYHRIWFKMRRWYFRKEYRDLYSLKGNRHD